jgi:hypothetical protein
MKTKGNDMKTAFVLENKKTNTTTVFRPMPDEKLVDVVQVVDDMLGHDMIMPVEEAREFWMRLIRTGFVQCR